MSRLNLCCNNNNNGTHSPKSPVPPPYTSAQKNVYTCSVNKNSYDNNRNNKQQRTMTTRQQQQMATTITDTAQKAKCCRVSLSWGGARGGGLGQQWVGGGGKARTEWDAGATVTKTMLTKMAKKKWEGGGSRNSTGLLGEKIFQAAKDENEQQQWEAKWLEYIRNCLYCFVRGGRGCCGWVLVTKCEMNANGKGISLDYVQGFNYFSFKNKLLFRSKSK